MNPHFTSVQDPQSGATKRAWEDEVTEVRPAKRSAADAITVQIAAEAAAAAAAGEPQAAPMDVRDLEDDPPFKVSHAKPTSPLVVAANKLCSVQSSWMRMA